MDMIRDNHRDVDVPNPDVIAMLDCFEKRLCDIGEGQLIPSTRLAANGDEIAFLCGINPERNVMSKPLSDR